MVSCPISPFFHSLQLSYSSYLFLFINSDRSEVLLCIFLLFFFFKYKHIFQEKLIYEHLLKAFLYTSLKISSEYKETILRIILCLLLHLFQGETVNEHLSSYSIIIQCLQARFVTCFIDVSVVIHKLSPF